MGYEQTPNGVPYDWWTAGPLGAHFQLMPIKGIHTTEEVEEACKWLRKEHDVVSMSTYWRELK